MTAVNRFALSVLSRSNKAQSVNGEMMMDKETGQLLVKTPSGDIISYDSVARLKSHINDVSILTQTNGIRGDIHQIEFENLELPLKVNENTNFLTSPLVIKATNPKRFLVSVDMDTIELATGQIGRDPTITMDIQFSFGGVNTDRTFTSPLSLLNTQVIDSSRYFNPTTSLTGHTLRIVNIRFAKNTGYTSQQLRHILHSVLVIVE